MTGRFRGAGI